MTQYSRSNGGGTGRKALVPFVLGGALLALAGCSRDSVSSYEVPKEDHSVKIANSSRPAAGARGMGEMAPHGGGGAQEPVAAVKWAALPKGWEEGKPDDQGMSVAKLRIAGENGQVAEVGITPLPGMARAPFAEGEIVKMWAQQLQLPEPTGGLPTTPVEIAGAPGKMYDLTSAEPNFDGKVKTRMTTAVLSRDGALWFVKLAGAEPVVTAQQDNFKQFLKGLSFEDPAGGKAGGSPLPQMASASASAASSPELTESAHPEWKKPAGWKEVAAGQMMVAAYEVQTNGKRAKVTVVPLGGGGGDLAANVNRWRGQVGLGAASDAEMKRDMKSIKLADGSDATEVHAKGAAQTLHGLIVPRGAQTWYYKILGDDEAVNAEAAKLPEFAASAK